MKMKKTGKIIVPQKPEDSKEEGNVGRNVVSPRKQELQKKIVQFQILQANLQLLMERERIVAEKLAELEQTKQALEDLKSVKAGSTALIPLGSGNFVAGELKDSEKILVGFGSGVAIKKSQEDAKKIMNERVGELNSALQDLDNQIRAIEFELHKLEPEIQELAKEK